MATESALRLALHGLDPCVHCGFCLQACPTFVATGDESDSPRGRIVLMQQEASGAIDVGDQNATYHLDRCLGCRACETVCPSGVEYGPALEAVRAESNLERPLPLQASLALTVFAQPALRRPLLALARWIRPLIAGLASRSRVGFAAGMLAATTPWRPAPRRGSSPPHRPRGSVAVFRGCVMEGLFGHVNDATARVLAANGYAEQPVPEQGCCGALHAHAGLHDQAVALARQNVLAFASQPNASIAVNSAGCGAILKDYGRLLKHDPLASEAEAFSQRVRDVSELLAEAGPRQGAPLKLRVTYDAPCHLCHAQRVTEPPIAVLRAVPGLDLPVHTESDVCCGSAGLYSLLQTPLSQEILDRKLAAIRQTEPDVVATGNPGCIMHIGAGLRASGGGGGGTIPVVHPVEVLDRSYLEAGFY
jgi:glycolate dehydrogenase iron-sulfur subunit